MNEYVMATIISLTTGISGFIFGFNKRKQELYAASLENIHKQINIYEKIIDNLRGEIHILVNKVEEQNKTIEHLELKVEKLMKEKK